MLEGFRPSHSVITVMVAFPKALGGVHAVMLCISVAKDGMGGLLILPCQDSYPTQ